MIISSTYGRGNKYFQRTRRPQRVIDRTGLLPTLGDAGYSFPGRELVPAASAVDEAVVAHSVPRSGCNVAGGPSDKPGYEAKLVRSIGTSATGAIATHSDDRRLLSTKYTKSTDWWRNQNKDMTGFKANSW
jgi:hypothetical protein